LRFGSNRHYALRLHVGEMHRQLANDSSARKLKLKGHYVHRYPAPD
jgi:hypothetical protein